MFLLFFFGILGIGLDGFYQFTLDDSVRIATREIQIDGPAQGSQAGFVAAVCREFGVLDANCAAKLTYNVQGNTLATGFAALTPAPLSAAGALPNGWFSNPNGANYANYDNYLVQVAYPLPFQLPYVSKLITYTGTASILSTAVARSEPFN